MPERKDRSWIGQRLHNFGEGWRQHPWQHVVSTVAGMAGGPLAGRGLQAVFDARNRGINNDAGNRGQQLGDAMQQSLDQRIWNPSGASQPSPTTEGYGPWAGGYRGANVPQPQGSDNIAQTLGLPDYNGDQVPNSPAAGAQPLPQQVVQHSPFQTGYSTGGGHGAGWGNSDMDTGKLDFFQQGPGIGSKIDLGSLAEAMAQRYMAKQTK